MTFKKILPTIIYILTILSCSSENENNTHKGVDYKIDKNRPYHEFEQELTVEICDCIKLGRTINSFNFLDDYEDCVKKTSSLLKTGLDKYPEDSLVTKKEYKQNLEELITEITSSNRCYNSR